MSPKESLAGRDVSHLVHDAPGRYGDGSPSENGPSDRVPEGVRADGFSPAGLDRYAENVDSYARDLASLSQKIARRSNADAASPHHVERASEALTAGRSRRGQAASVIGSLLLGGTVTMVVSAFTGAQQTVTLLSVGLVTTVIGTIALMYGWMR